MESVVAIIAFIWMTHLGSSADDIKGLRITSKDFVFTASWEPVAARNETESDDSTPTMYTLSAYGLNDSSGFAPVTNCANVTEHICVIDPDIYDFIGKTHWKYKFKVYASSGDKAVGESSVVQYVPFKDRYMVISPPEMNITRDGKNITVYLESPLPLFNAHDSAYFEIEAFRNDSLEEGYTYTTTTVPGMSDNIVSWITSAPQNVTICVKARYLFDIHYKYEGQWRQKCIRELIQKKKPEASTDDVNLSAEFGRLPTLVTIAVLFGVIVLVLLIVGFRMLFIKHYRNPFQDPNLTLPRNTVIATNTDENDKLVIAVQPPEKYDNIRASRESSNNNLSHYENDVENAASTELFIAGSDDTELSTPQQLPLIKISPVRNFKIVNSLTNRNTRVESADSAFCDGMYGLTLSESRMSPESNSDRCSPLHESPGSCESVFMEDEAYIRVPFDLVQSN
uniref:uncharacterized protein LOC120340915 isoform X1 n=1 Tax=Styela clava TaxID=7725 RepID=UPI00193A257E|nr:uncharacterized protein LOC120340915 isoform X1 [Styela clava]